ncbi:hypothetical protein ACTPEM_22610, partial [Clostridioides difficile]
RNTKELVPTIKEAFRVANSGRKGPVLVDVPKDLFLAEMDFSGGQSFKSKIKRLLPYCCRNNICCHRNFA